jgi:hypothetical protein
LAAEIWCFVDLSDLPQGFSINSAGVPVQRGIYAVVESTSKCPNYRQKRAIVGCKRKRMVDMYNEDGTPTIELINNTSIWEPIIKEVAALDPTTGTVQQKRFYLADVESIVAPACVIPDLGSSNKVRYFRMKPRSEWATSFSNWLRAPHADDMAEIDEEE